MKAFLIFALTFLRICDASAADAALVGRTQPLALTTIPVLDVSRYMGSWYEIAKFPNWFQKKCVGYTKADYSLQADGSVRVINRCKLASGEMDEAIGSARQIGGTGSARLQVRFAPAWLSFISAVWGDYWVVDLDENYQLAAVSEPGREYLWVLARTPKVNRQQYEDLLDRLKRNDFDVAKLEVTRQEN